MRILAASIESRIEPGKIIHSDRDEYVPGQCNLGSQEIRMRKRKSVVGLVITVLFVIGLQIFDPPQELRLLLFIPLAYTIICYYQAQQKFCVVFGIRGIFNFEEIGYSTDVIESEDRIKDRNKAWMIIFRSLLLAFIIVALYFFLPV